MPYIKPQEYLGPIEVPCFRDSRDFPVIMKLKYYDVSYNLEGKVYTITLYDRTGWNKKYEFQKLTQVREFTDVLLVDIGFRPIFYEKAYPEIIKMF